MDKIMSPIEFKAGMMRIARSEPRSPGDVWRAWNLVFAYIGADVEAKRDCSEMLRQDLVEQNADHDRHDHG